MLILAVKECRVFSRDAARVAIAFHPLVATEFAIGAHQSPHSASPCFQYMSQAGAVSLKKLLYLSIFYRICLGIRNT
jgi:hypothetical protein